MEALRQDYPFAGHKQMHSNANSNPLSSIHIMTMLWKWKIFLFFVFSFFFKARILVFTRIICFYSNYSYCNYYTTLQIVICSIKPSGQ